MLGSVCVQCLSEQWLDNSTVPMFSACLIWLVNNIERLLHRVHKLPRARLINSQRAHCRCLNQPILLMLLSNNRKPLICCLSPHLCRQILLMLLLNNQIPLICCLNPHPYRQICLIFKIWDHGCRALPTNSICTALFATSLASTLRMSGNSLLPANGLIGTWHCIFLSHLPSRSPTESS